MITQKRLKEVLRYSPIVGVFEWRVAGRRIRPGFLAGAVNKGSGYVVIGVDRKRYPAHQLAWLYMTGEWPPEEIDHKDGDRSNNAFNNLRLASPKQNSRNRRIQGHNTTGVKGVTRCGGKKTYEAKLEMDGERYFAGRFETLDEARVAIEKLRNELHGEFANHGIHGYEREEMQQESVA